LTADNSSCFGAWHLSGDRVGAFPLSSGSSIKPVSDELPIDKRRIREE